jgi:hypothetical protein
MYRVFLLTVHIFFLLLYLITIWYLVIFIFLIIGLETCEHKITWIINCALTCCSFVSQNAMLCFYFMTFRLHSHVTCVDFRIIKLEICHIATLCLILMPIVYVSMITFTCNSCVLEINCQINPFFHNYSIYVVYQGILCLIYFIGYNNFKHFFMDLSFFLFYGKTGKELFASRRIRYNIIEI